MPDRTDGDRSDLTVGSPSRRSFLQHSGVVVGGLAAGLAGVAKLAGAAPPKPRIIGPAVAAATPLKRSNRKLSVKQPVRIATAGGSVPENTVLAPPLPKPPPAPSTRVRLLEAIGASPGGKAILTQMGVDPRRLTATVRQPDPPPPEETPAGRTLAECYADGITLRRNGCDFGENDYQGSDPILYSTACAHMSADAVRAESWAMMRPLDASPDYRVMMITLRCPGLRSEMGTYLLEISMSSHREGWLNDITFQLNFTPLEFVETSSGSLLAVARMPGSIGTPIVANTLSIQDRLCTGHYLDFHWLNVIAV